MMTQEYVPLEIKGTIYWRVVDLTSFYTFVSREIHKIDDDAQHEALLGEPRGRVRSGTSRQFEAAEEWLRSIAEEQTRAVVARVNTGLLFAEQIVSDLPPEIRKQVDPNAENSVSSPASTKSYRSATDGLAGMIHDTIAGIVPQYGIEVHRVALQEVRLPEQVHRAAVDACITAYKPLAAQRDAAAKRIMSRADADGRKMHLEAAADVMGADAVAKREVVGSVQPFAFGNRYGAFASFLTEIVAGKKRIEKENSSGGAVASAPQHKPAGSSARRAEHSSAEGIAKKLLHDARHSHDAGDANYAIARLQELIDAYPNTKAATEAREYLEELSSQ